jgi:enoyl-CoA hydratase
MAYETITVETRGQVGLITLDRPEALNALNAALIGELATALKKFDEDSGIGAIVLTGSEKAFAAGADIKEMAEKTYPQAMLDDFIGGDWEAVGQARKPIIAAVSGYALGGGCELAMACDFILATEGARFGLPEITLGVIPGVGGTQRLVRAVGKAKAMEMILSGRFMAAEEAERAGLVSRIVPDAELVDEAVKVAQKIADMSLPAVILAKSSVDRSFEMTLAEGMRYERDVFYSLFATEDQKEGMAAFVEKRQARFRDR